MHIPVFGAAVVALAVAAGAQAAMELPCKAERQALLHQGHAGASGAQRGVLEALPLAPRRGAPRPRATRAGGVPAPRQRRQRLSGEAAREPLSADFLADVRGAIADLPPAVRRAFDATFAGVWFVDDLGGTGYTDMYSDASGKPAGGFIVLDAAVLGKFTANAWATWKENTPFKPAKAWKLEARIEDAARDDRRGAIRYILLHELGHVLSINRDVHPRWDMPPGEVPATARFPFFELSWTVDRKESRYASKFDADFPARRSVVYYLGAKLDAADMAPAYGALRKTNFPTLYAATSPGDDFAESFVSYVHTVLMKRPWEITIRKDGKVAMTYRTCWEEPRCAAKRRILEVLLR